MATPSKITIIWYKNSFIETDWVAVFRVQVMLANAWVSCAILNSNNRTCVVTNNNSRRMRKNVKLESLVEREEKSELLSWSEQVVHDMRISTADLHNKC